MQRIKIISSAKIRNIYLSRKESKGENQYIDNQIFGLNKKISPKQGYKTYFAKGSLLNEPQNYKNVRGKVENDHQEYLLKEWISYLREKYTVEIDESVLNRIK